MTTKNKLTVFNQISMDGFFTDANNDMSWAHKDPDDSEWNEFVAGNAEGGSVLLFGRITYEMMAGFWPTPAAAQMNPVVARNMNAMKKVVFSKTMKSASWNNTELINGHLESEIQKLKKEAEGDITILGSGTIVSQLAAAGLIDEYSIVVNPLILGSGRTMFESVDNNIDLELQSTRVFKNGSVFMSFLPA